MKIFDHSILALPLFEDGHRKLAREIEEWVKTNANLISESASLNPDDRGRYLTKLIGQDGWYQHIIGNRMSEAGGVPDFRAICLIREGFAFADDLCDFAFSIQGLGTAPVVYYGSEVQKQRYLSDLSAGNRIASLAISEPGVGSNPATVRLQAAKQGNTYVLNGEKTWLSNGSIADYHCVFARTGEGPGAMGLSCFIVPMDTPGLSVKEQIELTAPRSFASLAFRDCIVPEENLIGRPGLGFQYAMDILERYRITVGSAAVGFCRRAMGAAVQWSRSQTVGDVPLFDLQMTKEKLSGMAVFVDAASLLVARAAYEVDTGVKAFSRHSSIAKLYATENAQKVVDDALQLFGAAGLVKGSLLEKLYREIRSLRIYEGTSEIQKLIIAGSLARS